MLDPLTLIGSGAALASLPGSLNLAALSLAALRRPANPAAGTPESGRLAIIVPAHNEAAGISDCVCQLLVECLRDGNADLWVVADNCTDNTASLAYSAGAEVIIRHNAQERGKGYALDYAFRQLTGGGYAWFIVIDADSAVQPGFLSAMREAMQPECQALQACYLARPAHSLRGRLARFAQFGFNHVRPLGRARLGQSAGILGNGFALRSSLLQKLPYRARSVVEDLEYHLDLLEAGERVHYVPKALVLGEIAESTAGSAQQRTRWEGGRLRILRERSLALAGRILGGQWQLIEALSDLALLPLGLHCLLLLLAFLAPAPLAAIALALGGSALAIHIAAIFRRAPATRADLLALCSAPFYLVWKLSLLPATLANSRKSAAWVRSERMTQHESPCQ